MTTFALEECFPGRRRCFGLVHVPRTILAYVQCYLHSLESVWAVWVFNAAAAALISHKVMMIWLHGPLSGLLLLVLGPCLFVFDLLTLMVLHWGLASTKSVLRGLASVGAVLIMVCSATFASLYLEGSAELNWSRSVEVHLLEIANSGHRGLEDFQKTDGAGS
jgi:hypothetical protein